MSAPYTAGAPRWKRHSCAGCAFLGTARGIDVYECFTPDAGPYRSFTVRSGPLPHGGTAVLTPSGWIVRPPGNVPPIRVLTALNEVVGRIA